MDGVYKGYLWIWHYGYFIVLTLALVFAHVILRLPTPKICTKFVHVQTLCCFFIAGVEDSRCFFFFIFGKSHLYILSHGNRLKVIQTEFNYICLY